MNEDKRKFRKVALICYGKDLVSVMNIISHYSPARLSSHLMATQLYYHMQYHL